MSMALPRTRMPAEESHERVAMYLALGYKREEIAVILQLTATRVSQIAVKPTVKQRAKVLREQFTARQMETAADMIAADAVKNVEFMQRLRDGDKTSLLLDDDHEFTRLRFGAAKELLDRQAPKRTESTSEVTTKILIENEERALLDDVAREMGEEPIALEDQTVDGVLVEEQPMVEGVPSIDDVLRKYADDEPR